MALSLLCQSCSFLFRRLWLLDVTVCSIASTLARVTVVSMVNQRLVGLRRHTRRLYAIDIDSLLDLLVQMHDNLSLIRFRLIIRRATMIVLIKQLMR